MSFASLRSGQRKKGEEFNNGEKEAVLTFKHAAQVKPALGRKYEICRRKQRG